MKPKAPGKRNPKPKEVRKVRFTNEQINNYWQKFLRENSKPIEGLEVITFMKHEDIKALAKGSMYVIEGKPIILKSWETHPEYDNTETSRIKLTFEK